jgi:quinol monooxygenase YgiN
MSFVQIIQMHTARFDELEALDAQWEQATEGKRTLRRSVVARDRNDPDRYVVLAFFDSYESAMENSNLPETAEFAEKLMALLDGPPTFHDLDVVHDRS